MGINMGVYIGLVCLLLACQGVVSRDSQNSFVFNSNGESIQVNSIQIGQQRRSARRPIEMVNRLSFVHHPNATSLSADPMTVTPMVTKELVYTCEVGNTTTTNSSYFTLISSINIVAIEKGDNDTKEEPVATIDVYGKRTKTPYNDENLTGAIYRHPADPQTQQTSGTGNLRLSISYPTVEQIYSCSTTKRTVCKVYGMVGLESAEDEVDVSVNIVEHTFQSLGGDFKVSPNNIKPLLSEKLTVECNVIGIEAVKTVNRIWLYKDGVLVAGCGGHWWPAGHCGPTNTTNFPDANITGSVHGSSGNLKAIVNYPKEVHSGSFYCYIDLANQEERPLEASSDDVDVNATDPTLKDLIDWTIDNKQEADEEIEKLKAKNKEQSKMIQDAEDEIKKLKVEDTDLNTRIDDADDDIKDAKDQRVKMTNRIKTAENEIKLLKSKMAKAVAFTAVMEGPNWSWAKVGYEEILKFNKALVNKGGGYNTNTGVFTCPESGTYYISFNLQAMPKQPNNELTNSAASLLLNSDWVTFGVVYGKGSVYGTMGAGVVLQLRKGDTLKVAAQRESYFYWVHFYQYAAMFTGFLLY